MFFVVVDSIPEVNRVHGWLKERIDPIVDATGIWQETWKLFAPDTDKVNIRVRSDILYDNGLVVTWESPDWSTLSVPQRFLHFREMAFLDKVC